MHFSYRLSCIRFANLPYLRPICGRYAEHQSTLGFEGLVCYSVHKIIHEQKMGVLEMSHSAETIRLCDEMHAILDEMPLTKDGNKQEELRTGLRRRIWEMERLHKLKNERGAGRKLKGVSGVAVVYWKRQGETFRQIAKRLGISAGLAHKLYQEENEVITDEYLEEFAHEFI